MNSITPPTPPPVPEVVHTARSYIRDAMDEALDELTPNMARICRYYFGWCDAEGNPVTRRGSRSLQASLVMLAAQATGEDPLQAVPGAVAVEMVHNFSLLHDDVIDDDRIRRERPAAWVVYGRGPAILAGDCLLAASTRILVDKAGPRGTIAARILNQATSRMLRGMAQEAHYDHTDPATVDLDEYLTEICEAKGGALLGSGALLGTVLCGHREEEGYQLRKAAHHAGLAWQATNDVENIWGNAHLVGKPGMQDLKLKKHTLPVIAAIQSKHPAAADITEWFRRPAHESGDVGKLAALLEEAGGREIAERAINHHLEQALHTVESLSLPESVAASLADLLYFAVTRQPRGR
ncbi:polyprenyl synthetase family protein [Streptomyces sp. NPDC001667]